MKNNKDFWFNNNYDTLINDYQIIPNINTSLEENCNRITKLIILFSFIGCILFSSVRFLISGVFTIILIIFIYNIVSKKISKKENFININASSKSNKKKDDIHLKKFLKEKYYNNDKKNPFGNVLLTEINDTPGRQSAPPLFNLDVEQKSTENVKKAIQELNPDINTNKELFGDLWDNFTLDQSNRIFFSTANTKIANDQGAFAEFLYGNMPSAKEGNPFALLQDNYRYILR